MYYSINYYSFFDSNLNLSSILITNPAPSLSFLSPPRVLSNILDQYQFSSPKNLIAKLFNQLPIFN